MNQFPYSLLTANPISTIHEQQIEQFSFESIHAEKIQPVDPPKIDRVLAESEEELVLGADLGGDKAIVRLFKVTDGKLQTVPGYEAKVQGDDGTGYLNLLEDAAIFAETASISLGISWGGPLDDTRPLYHPKAKMFIEELTAKYDGDISAISPAIKAVMNDGPAGALSGALQAYKQFQSKNSMFIINGGGIGTSVIKDGSLYAAEAGHVTAIQELNTYNQTIPCGVYENSFVCLERLGANKAGIETQWEMLTGEYLRARDIEDRYKEGNQLAAELYDNSARIVAHVLIGTAKAMSMSLTDSNITIIGHGGAFKFPAYGERIQQILEKYCGKSVQFIMTKDFGAEDSNACLDGAAIAALCY